MCVRDESVCTDAPLAILGHDGVAELLGGGHPGGVGHEQVLVGKDRLRGEVVGLLDVVHLDAVAQGQACQRVGLGHQVAHHHHSVAGARSLGARARGVHLRDAASDVLLFLEASVIIIVVLFIVRG
jgi:hypothetical protein